VKSPLGLDLFESNLYFLSEADSTLFMMNMFATTGNHSLQGGLPKSNDMVLTHPARFPSAGQLHSQYSQYVYHQLVTVKVY